MQLSTLPPKSKAPISLIKQAGLNPVLESCNVLTALLRIVEIKRQERMAA